MKVWINTAFEGLNPVGTAAIVRAKTRAEAARLLSRALFDRGLNSGVKVKDMVEFIDSGMPYVKILLDGGY